MMLTLPPQINTQGLVAHYKLWAGLMNTGKVFDYALNGNEGTVLNAIPQYPGFLLDGASGSINCGSDSTIDNIFDGGGTYAAWIKPVSAGEANLGTLAHKGEWTLNAHSSATITRFHHDFSGDDGRWTFPTLASVWQFIAITYNSGAVGNNPIAYVNGIAVNETEVITPTGTRDTDAGSTLYIGNNNGDSSTFDGTIGDVLLFGKILSAAEIRSIYEQSRWRYQK